MSAYLTGQDPIKTLLGIREGKLQRIRADVGRAARALRGDTREARRQPPAPRGHRGPQERRPGLKPDHLRALGQGVHSELEVGKGFFKKTLKTNM